MPDHVYIIKNGPHEEDTIVFVSLTAAIAASVAYPDRRVHILSRPPISDTTTLLGRTDHVMYVLSGDYYQCGRLVTNTASSS
jgi:hypothetical protein